MHMYQLLQSKPPTVSCTGINNFHAAVYQDINARSTPYMVGRHKTLATLEFSSSRCPKI